MTCVTSALSQSVFVRLYEWLGRRLTTPLCYWSACTGGRRRWGLQIRTQSRPLCAEKPLCGLLLLTTARRVYRWPAYSSWYHLTAVSCSARLAQSLCSAVLHSNGNLKLVGLAFNTFTSRRAVSGRQCYCSIHAWVPLVIHNALVHSQRWAKALGQSLKMVTKVMVTPGIGFKHPSLQTPSSNQNDAVQHPF